MKERIIYFVMILSLAGLAGFLGFWLRKSYVDVQRNIKTDLAYHIVKAGSAMKDSVIIQFIESSGDRNFNPSFPDFEETGPLNSDLIKKMRLRHNIDTSIFLQKIGNDSIISIHVIKDDRKTLNRKLIWSKNGEQEDTLGNDKLRSKITKEVIERNLDTLVNKADIEFFLQTPNLVNSTKVIKAFEQDPFAIMVKILPEILLSFLLFIAVALSFFLSLYFFKEQQKLNMLKDNFISNMTHELKTPIATVSVALEAMTNFNILENKNKSKEYLDISKNEITRLNTLVDNVLKFNQIQSGGINLNMEKVDLALVANEVKESMKVRYETSNVALFENHDGQHFFILGDKMHLKNILYNLMDNALKYAGNSTIVEINIWKKGGEIFLKIRDEGIGIEPAYHHKIFERFFRVPQGDVHNSKGFGLGLAYVKQMTEAHGGEISVESRLGFGSSFILKFPANA